MHVPFARHQQDLFLGKVRVDICQRNAMKTQIPRSKPRKLPFIRHGENIAREEMTPIAVASFEAFGRRNGLRGIAVEPIRDHVVVILLGPKQAGERLASDQSGVVGEFRRHHGGIEFVGFFFT